MEFKDEKYSWKNMSLKEFICMNGFPSGWKEFFNSSKISNLISEISDKIDEYRHDNIIYPCIYQVFKAFYLTPLENVKAVMLGQDPYHTGTTEYDGSAMGLCFSVRYGNKINPSLKNIYNELILEGYNSVQNGDLTHWAKKGVLMLNNSLTVNKGEADSHTYIWETFSKELVKYIDEKKGKSVHWLLFGSNAHEVENIVKKGIIHKTSHPSPFSAHRSSKTACAFIGSNIFKDVSGIKW